MNVLVLMPYLYDTVPGQRFRIEQWARELEPSGAHFHFVPFESETLRNALHHRGRYGEKIIGIILGIIRRVKFVVSLKRNWDVIFLFRELLPIGPALLERVLARKGIPIVYDFDDAIFLHDVSDANKHFKRLKWPAKTGEICDLSTHVTVGNPYLQHYARRFNRTVSILPTTIDTATYTPQRDTHRNKVPVIGWSGSFSTVKHLETVGAALQVLRRSVKFKLKVVGTTDFALPGIDVESKPWDARLEVSDISSFDVGIMPLPDDAWSRGKCGLKALQYMALGVPTVASPVGVNTQIIQDGKSGILASSESEWVENLEKLLNDGELRNRLGKAGRDAVEHNYSARVQAPRLLNILNDSRRSLER